ncbi:hypothetical protein [Virgisporangium aurantiacum]|uniref:hypothetical protein n=1 Tax=Virgisporangium aurantiacum TaxID=175570 RepID=UPI0019510B96|nr:hypothetical protein [Virgisporangium aurantiacum]
MTSRRPLLAMVAITATVATATSVVTLGTGVTASAAGDPRPHLPEPGIAYVILSRRGADAVR